MPNSAAGEIKRVSSVHYRTAGKSAVFSPSMHKSLFCRLSFFQYFSAHFGVSDAKLHCHKGRFGIGQIGGLHFSRQEFALRRKSRPYAVFMAGKSFDGEISIGV